MASTTEKPVDPEYTSEPPPPPPPATTGIDYFQVDVALRVLLFASSLVAVVVIFTSQQTELFPSISPLGPSVPKPAKFKNYPSFIYFVAAFSVAGLYSILTALASISVIPRTDLKLKFLLHFIFWDTLILGIVASATGAAGGVSYLALKGDNHVNWTEVCNVYDKFCRHLAGSLAVALFACVVSVFLLWLSATTLHSRIPK